MRRHKQALSLLLVFVMLLGMFSQHPSVILTALAEEETETEEKNSEEDELVKDSSDFDWEESSEPETGEEEEKEESSVPETEDEEGEKEEEEESSDIPTEEPEEPQETEEVLWTRTITDTDGESYEITVTYNNLSLIPEDAELKVTEILSDEEMYESYAAETIEAAGLEAKNVRLIRLFDITIVDPETGEEYQPQNEVSVVIRLIDEEVLEENDLSVVHLSEEASEVVESTVEGDSIEFATEGFSIFSVVAAQISETIEASDGNTYEINVTYNSTSGIPMEGVELLVSELLPGDEGYDEYIADSVSVLGIEAEDIEYSRIFDIRIVDETDHNIVYEPTGDVDVSIRMIGETLEDYERVSLLHFAESERKDGFTVYDIDTTVEGETVRFTTNGFSVYAIVAAKDPYVPGQESDISLPSEIDEGQGYYFSIYRSNTNYMTTTQPGLSSSYSNGQGEFLGTTSKAGAGVWYFEQTEESGKYYIYCKDGSANQYLYVYDTNRMRLDASSKTVFTVESTSNNVGNTNTFYIYVVVNNKNYALSVRGNRNFFLENRNNGANNNERVTIRKAVVTPFDYYELDGKTFSIAYHEENIKGAGLTSESSSSGKLNAVELLVRPDVLSTTGELLIAQDMDLTDWTFECIEGTKYYITTQIGGEKMYLTVGSGITLESSPTANSVISVESGTGENAGKYKFSGPNDKALTLSGGKAANGFVSSSSGGQYSWLNLVSKSALLDDSDFTVYSAEKVDLSDRTKVPDGAQVVLYTRKWNDTTKKYEFYAVGYDGSLARAFESGGLIQWVGSTINTMLWDFTEYQYSDGEPTYYYQLKNAYPGGAASNCIRPSTDGNFLRTGSAFPDYFDRSINLNGRRYGYYYSTILVWDDPSYAYIGLRVNDDRTGLEVCSMDEADTFYFAIMTDTPGEDESELTTVATVDHQQYGITVRMVDLDNGDLQNHNGYMSQFLGSNSYTHSAPDSGLLSTQLGSDGYPTATRNNNKSLAEMFAQAVDVNHLFIENTYYSSGYYEYDSAKNFASFYTPDGTYDPNNFTVYSQLASYDSGGNKNSLKHSQFFPYNYIQPGVYTSVNKYNLYPTVVANSTNDPELPDSDPRKGEQLHTLQCNGQTVDVYFAMEIEATFTQTPSGLDAWGHDIIYEFTGDDDFWLYVDGELIIDLGGIHGALPGSVNYSTGEVVVNGVQTTLRAVFEKNYRERKGYPDRASATAEQNTDVDDHLAEYFEGDGTIFKEYTDHTMRIFYMERGAGASNLHMRFNLASVKPGTVLLSKEIKGVDSTESYLSEYPFQIFYKDSEDVEHQLVTANEPGSGIRVVYKDTNRLVTLRDSYTAPDGQVYESVFVLKPGETAEIDFPDSAMMYYIRECAVDITTVDESTNPATTIHQGIYTHVTVNGEEVSGVPNGKDQGRQDFSIPYAYVDSRGRVVFQNWVDPNAKGTLTFTKHLYAEDGETPIPHEQSDTTFTFRLYLGTENTPADQLPLADMYSYHVKDDQGNYCRWDAENGKLVSLGDGKDHYEYLTDEEKRMVTFTTSMSGTITNIPVDYTVEVREIPAGTRYKVEERDYELPDGYTLQWYVTRIDSGTGEIISNDSKEPATGVINVISEYNEIEIRNLKGWGLRCYKEWSDANWMAERDVIYLAVFTEINGELTFVDNDEHNTVRRLKRTDESAYWFFQTIDDLDGSGGNGDAADFAHYVVREVTISNENPTVDDRGRVTDYGTVTLLPVDGTGQITLSGRQYGDAEPSSFTYTIVSYTMGDLPQNANVREDVMVNKRAGLDLYKTKEDGTTPLADAVFSLKDGNGNNAVSGTLTSDESGFITIAYLREDEVYTLAEIASPSGYIGLSTPLKLKREGNTVYVSDDDGATWQTSIANSSDGWYIVDDTDISSGEEIRIGKLTIKNRPYILQIRKTQQTAEGEPLPGATFALYRQVIGNNGQPRKDYRPIEGYESLVTDADGLVPEISEAFANGTLHSGTYYLHETYPVSGYQPLSEDVVFTVNNLGMVSLESSPSGVELSDNVIYVPNQLEGTAKLTVRKVVENGSAADTNGTNRFNFTIKLYLPDGQTPWPYSDGTGGYFNNGTASFSLGHDQTIELTVPLGAVATVTETSNTTYTTTAAMTVTTEGQTTTSTHEFNSSNLMSTVTIKDDTGVTLTYTNTRKTVQVTVKKTVVGSGGNFTFTVTQTDGETSEQSTFTLSPADNQTVSTVLTIPYGVSLTITENACPGYTTKVGSTVTSTWTKTGITSNQAVTFTNTETHVAPTGYQGNAHNSGYLILLLGGLLLADIAFMRRLYRKSRRRYRKNVTHSKCF